MSNYSGLQNKLRRIKDELDKRPKPEDLVKEIRVVGVDPVTREETEWFVINVD